MAHRQCSICGKPVILVPSAAERVRKDAERGIHSTNAQYLNQFHTHSTCLVAKRTQDSIELMRRLNADARARRVRLPLPA